MNYTSAFGVIDDLLDKSGTGYFTDNEKLRFLDMAVMEYTKGLINNLESNSKALEEISPLVVVSDSTSQSSNSITYPTDYFHLLRLETAEGKPITVMSRNEYQEQLLNPFKKATEDYPVALINSDGFRIHGTSSKVVIEYISKPSISSDTGHDNDSNIGGYGDISSDEIINIAVRKMMLSLEDPRYQLQVNELSAEKR